MRRYRGLPDRIMTVVAAALVVAAPACAGGAVNQVPDDAGGADDGQAITSEEAPGEGSSTSSTSSDIPESSTSPDGDDQGQGYDLVQTLTFEGFIDRLVLGTDHLWVPGQDLFGVDRVSHEVTLTHVVDGRVDRVGLIENDPARRFVVVTQTDDGPNRLRILTADGEEVSTVDLPTRSSWDIAVNNDEVWIGDGHFESPASIVSLDDLSVESIASPVLPLTVAIDDGSAWVIGHEHAELWRLDAETHQVRETFSLDPRARRWPVTVDVGGGYVWAGPTSSPESFYRFDPTNGAVLEQPVDAPGARDIVFAVDHLWVTATDDQKVLQIDPDSLDVVAEIAVDGPPSTVLASGNLLYIMVTEVPDLPDDPTQAELDDITLTSKLSVFQRASTD